MPARNRRWSSEEIEAMRKELLEEDKTLEEIGKREGVSRERIRQLVGNLDRGNRRSEAKRQKISQLLEAGLTDPEIAAEMNMKEGTIRKYRLSIGIRRPRPQRHTQEHAVWCAHKWQELYGFTPSSVDWKPRFAAYLGHQERVTRFREFQQAFDCPTTPTIQDLFGTWLNFIHATGLPPAPRGYPSIGRFSTAPKRIGSWRQTIPDGGWSKESIIAKALEWVERYGELPSASDWGAGNSFSKGAKKEIRLARYKELSPPRWASVKQHFGSFDIMLNEAKKRLNM